MPKPEEESTGFTYLRSGAAREGEAEAPGQGGPPEGQGPPEERATTADEYPEDGTIPAVKEWVGEDLGRAQSALDAEQDRPNPRSTLIDYLESMLSTDDE